jgi:glycosyltransferase involved in cell wall biosynthesis
VRAVVPQAFSRRPVGLGVRAAILSSFPPEVCGIAEYAEQQATRLERDGHEVERIALDGLRWKGWTRAALADVERRLQAADRAILHYQVGLFLDKTRSPRVMRFVVPHLALRRLARRVPHLEVVVHESSWKVWRGRGEGLQYPFVRRFFAAAPKLVFHTQAEKAEFEREFHLGRPSEVVPHHVDFVANTGRSQAEARMALGVPADERMALCIGFYAEPKGFEDAAARFAALRKAGKLSPRARLRIVTSVRESGDAAKQADLERLRASAAGDSGVTVDVRYVGNEEFDDWLMAADLVLLPYRRSFSSGVAARAVLLGRPVAVRDVGGLGEQVGARGRRYRTDAELDAVLLATCGA